MYLYMYTCIILLNNSFSFWLQSTKQKKNWSNYCDSVQFSFLIDYFSYNRTLLAPHENCYYFAGSSMEIKYQE